MRCDKCGVVLTAENYGSFAPYGIPLYVCRTCYNKLKESEKDLQNSQPVNKSGKSASKALVFNSLQEQLEYERVEVDLREGASNENQD